MSILKFLLLGVSVVVLGAAGALIFNVSLLPYFLASASFENFQFVKDFKEGKIVVNPKEEIYIQENTALQDSIVKVQKSMVTVKVGTGFLQGLIVTSDGLIVTLAKGLPVSGVVSGYFEGQPMEFEVVKKDSVHDLALLKLQKTNLPTVPFANVDQIKLGQRIFLTSAASLNQSDWLANEGIIRELRDEVLGTNIAEGASVAGSPLFNAAGELMGIGFLDVKGIVEGVPISVVKDFLGL